MSDNKYIINDYENEDYQISNALLIRSNHIDTLEINNSNVNLDTINNIIQNTNIKNLILNNCFISYENNSLINLGSLVINNITCNNYEVFIKSINLNRLEISNLNDIFDCYYLRKLEKVQELKLSNLKVTHIGGLGYLNELKNLYINNIPLKSWVFITKINKLEHLFISSDYDIKEIPTINININIIDNA